MKGTFLAFLLCLALALGGLGAAAHTLGTQGQGVEVSARPRQGDPAAAQGLVATQQAQYQPGRNRPGQWNGTLLWDLAIPLDNPAASRTACTFQRGDLPAPNDRQGITLTFPHQQDLTFYGYGCTEAELRLGGTDADPRLAPLYADVASRTPPGETRTETVDPRQYLDCYPLQVTVNLASQETDYDWSVSRTARAQEAALQEAFQTFFAFPFAPDTRWAVTVSKEDRGGPEANAITQASIRPVGPDVALDCRWALGADAVYFTFAPTQGEAGSLPEVSQVPGGYGIYRLALSENQKGAFQADPDSLALVYPLDPQGGRVLDLTLSADGQTLFLTTSQGEALTCAVVDTAGMTCRQTLSLPPESLYPIHRENGTRADPATTDPAQLQPTVQLIPGEGFLLTVGPETFTCFLQDAGGAYQSAWSAPTPEAFLPAPRCNAQGAWNGEKLALGCFDGVNGSPGLSLWVYDAHGALLYQGDYATSLSQVYGRYETLPNGQRRVSALSPIGRSVWPDLALTLTWQS